MTYKGHVENGVIIVDDPVRLDEGTEVVIQVAEQPARPAGQVHSKSRFEPYEALIGVLEDMPSDWADEHDRYLRDQSRS